MSGEILASTDAGYAVNAEDNTPRELPGTVLLYASDKLRDKAVMLFITPQHARELAAQLIASAELAEAHIPVSAVAGS